MSVATCNYGCGGTTDLRPYGPGGSWVCFPCATATPERERAAQGAYGALLDGAEAVSPSGATVLTSSGPEPLTEGSLQRAIAEAEAPRA